MGLHRPCIKATKNPCIAQRSHFSVVSLLASQQLTTHWPLVPLLVSMTPQSLGWPPTSLAVSSVFLLPSPLFHLWRWNAPRITSGPAFYLSPSDLIHFLGIKYHLHADEPQIYIPSPWDSRLWHPTACYTCLVNIWDVTYLKRYCFFPQPFLP